MKVKRESQNIPPLCKCNCGYPVERSKIPPYNWNIYIHNHHTKGNSHNLGRTPWNKGMKGSQIPWNKGFTKETDKRVAAYGKNSGKSRKGLISSKKGLTAETDARIKRCSKETRNKIKEGNFGQRRSEEAKQNMRKPKSEEAKANMKIAQNKPEVKKKHTGENNSNWQGGISKEPYSQNWSRNLKKIIKDRDGNACQLCFVHENELEGMLLKQGLVIHHIDYDKKNDCFDNFITLCHPCHGRTNKDREGWQSVFASQ
jgi:hypothetical protein